MDVRDSTGNVKRTPTHAVVTDARKTLGATAVLAAARREPPLDLSRLDAEAMSRIGPGWTLMTALQWLTGSKAHAVIAALAEQGTYAGLSKPQMLALARLAQSVTSTSDASQALALIRSSEG